ncbi:MAG: uracil-DNA glycosylase [Pseudomonadota bacterium]
MPVPVTFDPDCAACPRLADYLNECRTKQPDYHAAPVAPFGVRSPGLLIVGLAPGYHGANATGRPFTGDYAGELLYQTLHAFGFSTAPISVSQRDGLQLTDCRITNAVKCVPPQNKPTNDEIKRCNRFLKSEIIALREDTMILALGKIAHDSVLRALDLRLSRYKFAHGAFHDLDGRKLIDSYHCSRYNTQTGRLTREMFESVFATIAQKLGRAQ